MRGEKYFWNLEYLHWNKKYAELWVEKNLYLKGGGNAITQTEYLRGLV